MRDARRGETKESEHVVRACEAMAGRRVVVTMESSQGTGWENQKAGLEQNERTRELSGKSWKCGDFVTCASIW